LYYVIHYVLSCLKNMLWVKELLIEGRPIAWQKMLRRCFLSARQKSFNLGYMKTSWTCLPVSIIDSSCLRALLRLRLIIQTSLLGNYMRKRHVWKFNIELIFVWKFRKIQHWRRPTGFDSRGSILNRQTFKALPA